jgi:hypothetical protein
MCFNGLRVKGRDNASEQRDYAADYLEFSYWLQTNQAHAHNYHGTQTGIEVGM